MKKVFRILAKTVGWIAVAALLIFPVTPIMDFALFDTHNSWTTVGGLLAFGIPLLSALLAWGIIFLLQEKQAEKCPDTRQGADPSRKDDFFALAKISSWISVIFVLVPRWMSFLLISTRELTGAIGSIMGVFAFGHFLIGIVLALSAVVIGVCFFVLAVISCRWKKTFWSLGFALAYITTGVFNFLYQFSFIVLWTGGV